MNSKISNLSKAETLKKSSQRGIDDRLYFTVCKIAPLAPWTEELSR